MTDAPQDPQLPNFGQVPGANPPPPQQYQPVGQYAPGYQPVYVPPKHPQATLAMVLGIVGLTGIMCYVTALVAPFAWWFGAKAVKEIDANPMQFGGRGEAMAGKVMGIIGTILLILGSLLIAGLIVLTFTIDDLWDDTTSGYSLFGAL